MGKHRYSKSWKTNYATKQYENQGGLPSNESKRMQWKEKIWCKSLTLPWLGDYNTLKHNLFFFFCIFKGQIWNTKRLSRGICSNSNSFLYIYKKSKAKQKQKGHHDLIKKYSSEVAMTLTHPFSRKKRMLWTDRTQNSENILLIIFRTQTLAENY